MRSNTYDQTYRAFIKVYDSNNRVVEEKHGEGCSQIIWQASEMSKYKASYIRFYYPNDYLLPLSRNKIFLEWWVSIVKEWFGINIKYIGKFQANQIDINVSAANESVGYEYTNGKLSQNSYIINRGDLIVNDIWRGFEIKIPEHNIGRRSMLEYAGFCMIRYLFYSHFHSLVLDFLYLVRNKSALGINYAEDFTLFQLAHYNSSNYTCYSAFFGFIGDLNRNTSTVNKLVSLKDFKESLLQNNNLNNCFRKSKTTIICKEAQELLNRPDKIKELYERLK